MAATPMSVGTILLPRSPGRWGSVIFDDARSIVPIGTAHWRPADRRRQVGLEAEPEYHSSDGHQGHLKLERPS